MHRHGVAVEAKLLGQRPTNSVRLVVGGRDDVERQEAKLRPALLEDERAGVQRRAHVFHRPRHADVAVDLAAAERRDVGLAGPGPQHHLGRLLGRPRQRRGGRADPHSAQEAAP